MVIAELLELGMEILGQREYINEQLEVRLILAKLMEVDKSYIYAHEDLEVDKELEDKFLETMKKRSQGYPIQYILNEKEFMGLDFYLDEGVLIPRPDTENLVEYVIDYINENYKDRRVNVLDLGIGSGAIGLSIAHFCKQSYVYATDVSQDAIKVSGINKKRFKLDNVEILMGNLFEPVSNMKDFFDIIVSNPPYIESHEISKLQSEVKDYEPIMALDGGEDGLKYYRDISRDAKEFLRHGGLLIYEIGYNQAKKVSDILIDENYRDIEIIKDLQGLDRVILGRWGE